MKMKRILVVPTDREKHENEGAHVANRSQCKTEDSRKHLENESSVPRVAMDRGLIPCSWHGRGPGHTNTMLIQKLHSAVAPRQVSHEVPEPRAVNCVLRNLDTSGFGQHVAQGRCWVCRPDTRRPSFGSDEVKG